MADDHQEAAAPGDDLSEVEFRCPVDRRRLFGKLRLSGAHVVDGNLLEVACRTCSRRETRVLHRFNLLGECVDTELVPIIKSSS